MKFKSFFGAPSVLRSTALVKQWPMGWRASDPLFSDNRSLLSDRKQRCTPGAYGLLVGKLRQY